MNNKYTGIEEIFERVKREFGFEELYHDDLREWIWDAIGIMGTPTLLEDKISHIDVQNFRGELPVDLFSLANHILRDKETKTILRLSQDIFLSEDVEDQGEGRASSQLAVVAAPVNVDFPSQTGYVSIILPDTDEKTYNYTIRGNYIFCNIKDGTLELSYTAFPLDERGFPLIPDDPKTIRSVVWFIGERLAYKLMLSDKISERKYEIIKQDYLFNVASARSKSNTLSLPQMEIFKNRVLSMVKQTGSFNMGFK
jgi:hypothetical protein